MSTEFDRLNQEIDQAIKRNEQKKRLLPEYKFHSDNPELLTQIMRLFWEEVGARAGKQFEVTDFPLSPDEIKEKQKHGFMPVYLPHVQKVDFPKLFPGAISTSNLTFWKSKLSDIRSIGWFWIDSKIDNNDKKAIVLLGGMKYQSLRIYIIGSYISKFICGKHFDENDTRTRFPTNGAGGYRVIATIKKDGQLFLYGIWLDSSAASHSFWDYRSEELIKEK
jgi:hypothetical protein